LIDALLSSIQDPQPGQERALLIDHNKDQVREGL